MSEQVTLCRCEKYDVAVRVRHGDCVLPPVKCAYINGPWGNSYEITANSVRESNKLCLSLTPNQRIYFNCPQAFSLRLGFTSISDQRLPPQLIFKKYTYKVCGLSKPNDTQQHVATQNIMPAIVTLQYRKACGILNEFLYWYDVIRNSYVKWLNDDE